MASEKGSALFIILIAAALFAALGFAVTSSGRNTDELAMQTPTVLATQIIADAQRVATAFKRVAAREGSAITVQICDSATFCGNAGICTTGDGTDCIFAEEGGGIDAPVLPETAQVQPTGQAEWLYVSALAGFSVQDLGTSANEGFMVTYSADPAGGLTETVCREINKQLGYGPNIVEDTDGDGLILSAYPGKSFACYLENGVYRYYYAIHRQ